MFHFSSIRYIQLLTTGTFSCEHYKGIRTNGEGFYEDLNEIHKLVIFSYNAKHIFIDFLKICIQYTHPTSTELTDLHNAWLPFFKITYLGTLEMKRLNY